MDILQDYALQLLSLYNASEPYTRPIRSSLTHLRTHLSPLILPYLNQAAVLAQESPALISVGILLLFLLISLQILAWMKRVMMFWFRLVMRLVFWGAIGILVSVISQRGVGKTAEDVVKWGGELNTVWWREYERWEGYSKVQQQRQAFGGDAGNRWR